MSLRSLLESKARHAHLNGVDERAWLDALHLLDQEDRMREQSQIPLAAVEVQLRVMKPHQQLYKLVKTEMQRRGHWKNLPRGKAFAPDDGRSKPFTSSKKDGDAAA